MMDNVHSAMARMASIRSTMGIQQPVAPPRQAAATPPHEAIQTLFAQTLSQASSPMVMSPGTPYGYGGSSLTPIAGPVRGGPPRGLEGFQNGKIPPQALAPVEGTNELLWAPAAAAFSHMRRDAAQAGIALPIVDAYRSYEDQVRLEGELGLYSEGGLAAVPGTSQHGWGRALDLELDDTGVDWLRDNAWKYGFVETVPREPWHWEFHPAT